MQDSECSKYLLGNIGLGGISYSTNATFSLNISSLDLSPPLLLVWSSPHPWLSLLLSRCLPWSSDPDPHPREVWAPDFPCSYLVVVIVFANLHLTMDIGVARDAQWIIWMSDIPSWSHYGASVILHPLNSQFPLPLQVL